MWTKLVVLTAYGPPGLCASNLDDFGVSSFLGVQLALLFFFGVTVSALRIIHCKTHQHKTIVVINDWLEFNGNFNTRLVVSCSMPHSTHFSVPTQFQQ